MFRKKTLFLACRILFWKSSDHRPSNFNLELGWGGFRASRAEWSWITESLSCACTIPSEMNTLFRLLKTPSGKSSKANQVHAVNTETDNQEKRQNCGVTLFETVFTVVRERKTNSKIPRNFPLILPIPMPNPVWRKLAWRSEWAVREKSLRPELLLPPSTLPEQEKRLVVIFHSSSSRQGGLSKRVGGNGWVFTQMMISSQVGSPRGSSHSRMSSGNPALPLCSAAVLSR